MKRFDAPAEAAPHPSGRAATAEQRFAARVCRALDESAEALTEATRERLALARKAALRAQPMPGRRHATVGQLAFANGPGSSSRFGFARTSFIFSAILLVGACLAGLYQFEQERRIEELADMDTAVLNDDLPISAYADQGFNAFLKQNP